jgi:hypothetical protein
MENCSIKVEPKDEEPFDTLENAEPTDQHTAMADSAAGDKIYEFETVMIKVEPEEQEDRVLENENNRYTLTTTIEEHPVKLEEEQSDTLINGLPAPNTEVLLQEQAHDTGN